MNKYIATLLAALTAAGVCAQRPVDYVNPFIGSNNFGTTNPGAVCPTGMMSVVPFNVMGSDLNMYDKDARWWSTPYTNENSYFTGYAHTSLSGVGCPEMASMLLMPTSGELNVDYSFYGKLTYLLPSYGAVVRDTRFGQEVAVTLLLRQERLPRLEKELRELSSGTVAPVVQRELWSHFDTE